MCNGHADDCIQLSQEQNSQFVCKCKHRTCGIKCERCCLGFVQKPWKPATPDSSNECEREFIIITWKSVISIKSMLR